MTASASTHDRLPSVFRESAWRIVLSIFAGGASALLGATIVTKLFLVGASVLIVGSTLWFAPYLALRFAALRIYHDVSASRCNDRFIDLIANVAASPARARRHWRILREIADARKHPNRQILETVERELDDGFNDAATARIGSLIRRVHEAKARVRSAAKEHVRQFISFELNENTYLVLYGFSKSVCDALVSTEPFPKCTIVVVQDQQYGDASHNEHLQVVRALKSLNVRLRVVPFGTVEQLFSEKRTSIDDLDGSAITLKKNRRVLALIGCEAYAVDGTVLIPAQAEPTEDDSTTFIEIVQEAIQRSTQGRFRLAVVAESYKLRLRLAATDALVGTPLAYRWKNLPRLLSYLLTGNPRTLAMRDIQLVAVAPPVVGHIIDDTGCHSRMTQELKLSSAEWTRLLRPPMGPKDLGFTNTCAVYIFDMNGVLANDEHDHFAAFAEVVRRQQQTLTFDEYKEWCLGKSDAEGVDQLRVEKSLSGDTTVLVREKQTAYHKYIAGQPKPYAGAVELVQTLISMKKSVYLVTASEDSDAKSFLAGAGLAIFFDQTNTYTNVSSASRPATYLDILARAHIEPEDAVVVDDSPANLLIARSLRIRTIGVETTRPGDIRADQVVPNIVALAKLIAAAEPTHIVHVDTQS